MKKLLLLLFPLALFAEVVKDISYGLSWNKNTYDTASLFNKNEMSYTNKEHKVVVNNSGNYTFKDSTIVNFMGTFKVAYDYSINASHTVFVFDLLNINPVQNKKSDNSVAIGYKYTFFEFYGLKFDSSIAPMLTRMTFEDSNNNVTSTAVSSRSRLMFINGPNEFDYIYYVSINGSIQNVTQNTVLFYKRAFSESFYSKIQVFYSYESLINTYNQGITLIAGFIF